MLTECVDCDNDYKKVRCIDNGKYCPMLPETLAGMNDPFDPKEVLKQSVREQCVYDSIPPNRKAEWFIYVQKLRDSCLFNNYTKTI